MTAVEGEKKWSNTGLVWDKQAVAPLIRYQQQAKMLWLTVTFEAGS